MGGSRSSMQNAQSFLTTSLRKSARLVATDMINRLMLIDVTPFIGPGAMRVGGYPAAG